jgi:hypothetical protein
MRKRGKFCFNHGPRIRLRSFFLEKPNLFLHIAGREVGVSRSDAGDGEVNGYFG